MSLVLRHPAMVHGRLTRSGERQQPVNAYPALDFELGPSADILRETVSRFAADEIAPRAAEIDRSNEFPSDLWPRLGASGLLGITVEEEWGGAGMGYPAHVVAMEELSRASAAVGLSYGAHSNLCVNQIRRNATREQKQKSLPRLVSGEHVGALAMSEAGARGSDVVSMPDLPAVRRGDAYVLNGTKMWITNGPDADVLVVYAKTAPEVGARGITAFLVERGFRGFSTSQKLDKLGMRGIQHLRARLPGLRGAGKNVLGGEGKGVEVLMSRASITSVWCSPAGPSASCRPVWTRSFPTCTNGSSSGTPIGSFQLIQGKQADC